jgi:hypothetical protein
MKRKRNFSDDSYDESSDDSSDDNQQQMQIQQSPPDSQSHSQQRPQSHSPPDSQPPGDLQQPTKKRPIVLKQKTIPSKTRNDVNIAKLSAIQRRLRDLQLEKERQFIRKARLEYFEKKKEENKKNNQSSGM